MDSQRRLLVVGRGLIGQSVQRFAQSYNYNETIDWTEQDTPRQLMVTIERFLSDTPSWAIAWCAGNTTVGSNPRELDRQLRQFEETLRFVEAIARNQPDGRIFLASSAGGVFGSGAARFWTDEDQPSPRSPYGLMKVRQEEILASLGERLSIPTLSGRIANAYGAAQNPKKLQGLISVALRSALTRTPIQIHVPLESTRDYIYSDDIGRLVGAWVRTTNVVSTGSTIISSGRSVSISEVLRCVRLVAGRPCPVVQRQSPSSALQPLHVRLRPRRNGFFGQTLSPTPLEHGVSAVWVSLLRNLQQPSR